MRIHFGVLFELDLCGELADIIADKQVMDYPVGGIEIDCMHAQSGGG